MSWRQVIAAVAYLGLWAVLALLQPDVPDGVYWTVWLGSSLVAGLVIGRWWALLLAVGFAATLLAVSALDPCTSEFEECDINWAALLVVLYLPITLAALAVGVGGRKLIGGARGDA